MSHLKTSWRISFVLAASGLIVALALAECTVRFLLPEYVAAKSDTSFWHYHEKLGWTHAPGESGNMIFKDRRGHHRTVPVQINSIGYRDAEPRLEKSPDVTRVAVLGDSFVFGFGVREEEIFLEQIERSHPSIETINFAVSGYSNDQQLIVYEDQVLQYRPDIAIMTIVSNDYKANIQTVSHGYPKPRFVEQSGSLVLENIPVPKLLDSLSLHSLDRAFRHNSALYLFVTTRLKIRQWAGALYRKLTSGEPEQETAAMESSYQKELWQGVEFTKQIVSRFVTVSREHSIVALLLMVPSTPLHDSITVHQQSVAAYCDALPDCHWIAPYDAFNAAASDREVLYQADKNHWSARGHEIVAGVVAEKLQDLTPIGNQRE